MLVEEFCQAASREPARRFPFLVNRLGNIATPREYLVIADRLAAGGMAEQAAHMRASNVGRDLAAARALRPYASRAVSGDARFYRNLAGPGQTGARTLLIAFTDRIGSMTMPITSFLQHLPHDGMDVLVLSDASRNHYRGGCRGLGKSMPELRAALGGSVRAYGATMAIGASMGGLPAVRFGLMAGAERAISIGGRPWNDVTRIAGRAPIPPAFDLLCDCLRRKSRNLLFVHAAGHGADRAAATLLAGRTGGRTLGVMGLTNHAVLGHLWMRGAVPHFLATILGPLPDRTAAHNLYRMPGAPRGR